MRLGKGKVTKESPLAYSGFILGPFSSLSIYTHAVNIKAHNYFKQNFQGLRITF